MKGHKRRQGILLSDFVSGVLVGSLLSVAAGIAIGAMISTHVANLYGDPGAKATIYMGIVALAGVVATIFANGYMARRERDEAENAKKQDELRRLRDKAESVRLSLVAEVKFIASKCGILSESLVGDDSTPRNCSLTLYLAANTESPVLSAYVSECYVLGPEIAYWVVDFHQYWNNVRNYLKWHVERGVELDRLRRKKISLYLKSFHSKADLYVALFEGFITLGEFGELMQKNIEEHRAEYAPFISP